MAATKKEANVVLKDALQVIKQQYRPKDKKLTRLLNKVSTATPKEAKEAVIYELINIIQNLNRTLNEIG